MGNTNTVPRALDARASRLSGCDTCVRIFVHDHGANASLPNCNRSNQRFTAEHPLHAQLSAVVRSRPSHGSCPPQHLPATAERHGSSLREQFRLPVSGLSRSALLAKSHSREEARRSFHGEGVPVRLLAWVPLHPAWISYPDARSSDQFELHHDPVRLPGLTRARRLNRAGHFQGEGREAQPSATPSDGRDGR